MPDFVIPESVWENHLLNPCDKILMTALLNKPKDDDGYVLLAKEETSQLISASFMTVTRALQRMKALKLLQIKCHYGRNGYTKVKVLRKEERGLPASLNN